MRRYIQFGLMAVLLAACGGSDDDSSQDTQNKAPKIVINDYPKELQLGNPLILDASGSHDPEGESVSFLWSIVKKPIASDITILAVDSDKIDVNPDVVGEYIFKVIVCDTSSTCSETTLDAVSVSESSASNTPPVAWFDLNEQYTVGSEVKLDASQSHDVDGDLITYAWALKSKPTNSNAELTSINNVISSLTPDVEGQYEIKLMVNDGLESSEIVDLFFATKGNLAPVAHAGEDALINSNTVIQLDGSNSYDPDGESITYAWRVIEQPDDANVIIATPTVAKVSVNLSVVGRYVFSLQVTDNEGASSEDTVTVEVVKGNTPPVANAGVAQSVIVNDLVTLNGAESYDLDGDEITYQWSFVSKPDASEAIINTANAVTANFTPDIVGEYVVSLVVSDGKSLRVSTTDTVLITASLKNAKPVASISSTENVNTNTRVVLDGAASSDADGDILKYTWSLKSKPTFSSAQLKDSNAVNASFIADKAGSYVVELVVDDGIEASDPTLMSITATDAVNSIPAGSGILIKTINFYAIDEPSGNITLSAYSSACPSISAMDISPDGKLIGIYNHINGLFELDPYQLLCIKLGDVPMPNIIYQGLAIDVHGNIYVSDVSKLRHLDKNGVLIAEHDYSGHVSGVKGIDFSTDGKLYGYTFYNNGELVEIDPSTGVTTFVAKMEMPEDVTVYDFYDIDIDNNNIIRIAESSSNLIYRYDLTGKLLSSQSIDGLPMTGGFKAISYVE